MMRILGVDPSLRSTGYGVIEVTGNSLTFVVAGEIRNPAALRASLCLVKIGSTITEVIHQTQPTVVAIEGLVYVQNTQVAFTLGQVRGVIIASAAQAGLEIFEYAPRKAKQAVTGSGGSGKSQVAHMVKALLGMSTLPTPDVADALALAITHAQSCQAFVLNRSKPI